MACFHAHARMLTDHLVKKEVPSHDSLVAMQEDIGRAELALAKLYGCGRKELLGCMEQVPQLPIRTIFLDMDGVLVDFIGGALKAHGVKEFKHEPGEWAIHKTMGLTEARFWEKIDADPLFWEELEPTRECYEIVALAEEWVGPANVHLLTAPSRHPSCIPGKLAWVRLHLPDYHDRVIPTRHKRLLARTDRLLIDDSDANCTQFREKGGWAVLVPRVWNSLHEEATEDASEYVEKALDGMFGA